jgi:hypothetical protein
MRFCALCAVRCARCFSEKVREREKKKKKKTFANTLNITHNVSIFFLEFSSCKIGVIRFIVFNVFASKKKKNRIIKKKKSFTNL